MDEVGNKKRLIGYWKDRIMETLDVSLLFSVWKKTDSEIIYGILLSSLTISLLSLVFPLTLLQIYDRIIPNHSVATLLWLMVVAFISVILGSILKIIRTYVGAWSDAKFEHITGFKAFNTLLNCELSQYEQEGAGRHLKRITALQSLKQFYAGQALISLVDIPFIFVCLLLIGYIAGYLVLVPIVIIFFSILMTVKDTSRFQSVLKARLDHDDRRLNFILETISKIQTIKSNTMEAQMLRRYERLQKSSTLFDYRLTEESAHLSLNSMVFSQIVIVLVVSFGGVMVFNGHMTVGALAACTLLSGQSMQPINAVISMWTRLQSIKIAYSELEKIMSMPAEFKGENKPLEKIKGKITFENVSFQHTEKGPLLLDKLNLTVMPGETICIAGESGKSTMLNLLLQLMPPTEGRILIDDVDIREINPENLRHFIGYMPSQATLFKGTILQNLTMFDYQYEEKAKELCEKIGLAQMVEYFPDGYDTGVATQTTETLPRGIQQQIVIVRALVRDPVIILFDEANTTIDMEGDKKIRELLESLRDSRTMIITSHRPSFIALAQKQYELTFGQLRLINDK